MIWWEDFRVGDSEELGAHTFSEQEIVAFARAFDPQPIHTDPEAARAGFYGGLIASGWHTCAECMRLMVDGYMSRTQSLGSPGLDTLRWPKPVRPGDTIRYRRTVLEARPSKSRPEAGLVKHRWEGFNQRGEQVVAMEGWNLFGRRPADQ